MAELEKDVATFLKQGNLNAANRLENQLAILKVQLFLLEYTTFFAFRLEFTMQMGLLYTQMRFTHFLYTCMSTRRTVVETLFGSDC